MSQFLLFFFRHIQHGMSSCPLWTSIISGYCRRISLNILLWFWIPNIKNTMGKQCSVGFSLCWVQNTLLLQSCDLHTAMMSGSLCNRKKNHQVYFRKILNVAFLASIRWPPRPQSCLGIYMYFPWISFCYSLVLLQVVYYLHVLWLTMITLNCFMQQNFGIADG